MQTPQDVQQALEPRIRTIRTLWIGMVLSIGMYYVLTVFLWKPENANPTNTLSLMLAAAGVVTTLVSFPIKQKFLTRAIEQQRVQIVQQGYIIAWALVEVAALLGLLDFFITGNRFYYVLFLISAIGQLIHFPRRQDVLAASFKSPIV